MTQKVQFCYKSASIRSRFFMPSIENKLAFQPLHGFNEPVIQEYFSNLENINDKHQFTADRIFTVDETGVTTVQNAAKFVTPKGKMCLRNFYRARRIRYCSLYHCADTEAYIFQS